MMTDSVAAYINYFSGRGRGVLERALARSGRYDEMIRRTLKQEGVPQDLIYLAQAESGFHPTALSRAGAAAYGSSWPAGLMAMAWSAVCGWTSGRVQRSYPGGRASSEGPLP